VFRIVGMGTAPPGGPRPDPGAFLHAGYSWPEGMTTVNLAPASARKEGPALDLPIALALLQACGVLGSPSASPGPCASASSPSTARCGTSGGAPRCGRGRRRHKMRRPRAVPQRQAAAVEGCGSHTVDTLDEAVAHLRGTQRLPRVEAPDWTPVPPSLAAADEVRGQAVAVRAAMLAAVGVTICCSRGRGAEDAAARALARAAAARARGGARDLAHPQRRRPPRGSAGGGGLARARPFRAAPHDEPRGAPRRGSTLRQGGEPRAPRRPAPRRAGQFPRALPRGLRQPVEDGQIVLGRASGRERFPPSSCSSPP
jgi:magnesium chelatase family protein